MSVWAWASYRGPNTVFYFNVLQGRLKMYSVKMKHYFNNAPCYDTMSWYCQIFCTWACLKEKEVKRKLSENCVHTVFWHFWVEDDWDISQPDHLLGLSCIFTPGIFTKWSKECYKTNTRAHLWLVLFLRNKQISGLELKKKKKLLYTAMHLYMDQGRGGSPNLINPNPTTVCVLLYQKNCY